MLIASRNGSLVLVEQADHGVLAGDLTGHWGNDQFERPSPFEPVRLASAMHDEGWRQADAEPLFNPDAQRPLTFLELPPSRHAPLYKRGVDAVLDRDRYAGLLVSMHWTGLYRSRWGMQQPPTVLSPPVMEATGVVVEAEERRWAEVKAELRSGERRSDFEARLWHNYDLLQVWDLLSLYLCLMEIRPAKGVPAREVQQTLRELEQEPGERVIKSVPLGVGRERVDMTLRAIDAAVVALDPYPFDADSVTFSAPARTIPDRPYVSAEDAAAAFVDAERVTITGRITRAS